MTKRLTNTAAAAATRLLEAEAREERIYRLASEQVIGEHDTAHPCDEGHFDCALREDGPCTNRLVAECVARLTLSSRATDNGPQAGAPVPDYRWQCGLLVRAVAPTCDADDDESLRHVAVGTIGEITSLNHYDRAQGTTVGVAFPNGCAVFYDQSDAGGIEGGIELTTLRRFTIIYREDNSGMDWEVYQITAATEGEAERQAHGMAHAEHPSIDLDDGGDPVNTFSSACFAGWPECLSFSFA